MKNISEIVFCAERPDKGPSGGAAGVMYLLRKYMNPSDCKCTIRYKYRESSRMEFVKSLIVECLSRKDIYYICHEPDSASILGLLGKQYSLVYHQQGPIVQEYINHVKKPSKIKIIKKKCIERLAFTKANQVYFPSNGAAREYFNSPYAMVARSQVNVGPALYNTINVDEELVPLETIKKNPNCLTLLSVGTMSELKGQDQTFYYISSLVKTRRFRIRWITVGDGLMKDKIKYLCAELSSSYDNFEHIHLDKIPHGSVLYLDQISDIYIMLHRSSIFDLATLEAMKNNCAIVLSNIGGNLDFNVEDNVIMIDPEKMNDGLDRIVTSDIELLKKMNEKVFDDYFSPHKFAERYIGIIQSILKSDN